MFIIFLTFYSCTATTPVWASWSYASLSCAVWIGAPIIFPVFIHNNAREHVACRGKTSGKRTLFSIIHETSFDAIFALYTYVCILVSSVGRYRSAMHSILFFNYLCTITEHERLCCGYIWKIYCLLNDDVDYDYIIQKHMLFVCTK